MPSMQSLFSNTHVFFYKASGGRVGKRFRGANVMVLTTKGRKSGKMRETPLLYLEDGDTLVLVASNGGADKAPSWFGNLVADPDVKAQVGKSRRDAHARVATSEERMRLWPKVVAAYSDYDEYAKKTTREIPLVILDPVPAGER